jgi:sarcosine oxidase subunit gamma
MIDPAMSESPLVRFDLGARAASAVGDAGIFACEQAFLGHINLRGDPHDPRFVAAVRDVVGVAPPMTPNTVTEAEGNTVYWLGPDEWLIVTPGDRRAAVESELGDALKDLCAAVTDVSGGQTVVVVHGEHVRQLLAKGCPLDLHPRAFDIGRCAQTHLAKVPILIRHLDRRSHFEIVVRRSFADYFWRWLEDAAAEYGLGVDVMSAAGA